MITTVNSWWTIQGDMQWQPWFCFIYTYIFLNIDNSFSVSLPWYQLLGPSNLTWLPYDLISIPTIIVIIIMVFSIIAINIANKKKYIVFQEHLK